MQGERKNLKTLLAIAGVSFFVFATPALAKHKHTERWYQQQWCAQHGGVAEYVLPDKTRVDCLTTTHAWEFDFASKWYEGVTQALHYGRLTGKRPGLVLILE